MRSWESSAIIMDFLLYQFYFVNILFLFAVVAGQDAVGNVEVGLHRFVVGDALRIVTLHDATNHAC